MNCDISLSTSKFFVIQRLTLSLTITKRFRCIFIFTQAATTNGFRLRQHLRCLMNLKLLSLAMQIVSHGTWNGGKVEKLSQEFLPKRRKIKTSHERVWKIKTLDWSNYTRWNNNSRVTWNCQASLIFQVYTEYEDVAVKMMEKARKIFHFNCCVCFTWDLPLIFCTTRIRIMYCVLM